MEKAEPRLGTPTTDVDQISRYIKCGVIFIKWGRKSSNKVGVQDGGCGRARTRSHDERDETRVGCLSRLQFGKVIGADSL